MSDSQYARLPEFMREYIYRKKWTNLRDIQEEAIGEVLDGGGHILIASGTASGKTEACFFPVMAMLCKNKPASVGVLYIGPLKALINDQGQRLKPLADMAGIPVRRWHGDVPGSHKKSLLENPSGILQITPESLEALLLRSPAMIRSLFCSLAFVIIDEIHSFMGSARGSQVLCQLARIEEAALCRPRRIGLSATLGDYRQAMEWLNSGSGLGKGVSLIRGGRDIRRVKIAVDYFSGGRAEEFVFYESLYREVRGRRCIIFCNSRNETEEVIAAIKNFSKKYRDTDRFFIHHGSVCASLRMETERELRDSAGPVTAAATATLEMGIDIGKLEKVIQVGAPLSVSAFVQRLGRSGRLRQNPAIYFTSIEENKYSGQPDRVYLINSLPWDLIKTIAIIELYLEEKWIESGDAHPLPYSLFVHQCLSILCSLGAHTRTALKRRLLSLPAFSGFSADDFDMLLDQLISLNLAEKTEEGEIIAGTEAGRLASHYSFYSVFNDAAEYRVISGGKEIGFINFIPPEGSCFILGGRHWTVEKTAPREREIIVSQGGPGGRSLWRGSGAELHPRVAAYMRKILVSDREYPYLSDRALQRLRGARAAATDLRLEKEIFIADNFMENAAEDARSQTFALIPWLGSKAMRTLILIMQNRDHRKSLGIKYMSRENDLAVSITSSLSVPAFRAVLSEILARYKTSESLYSLVDPSRIPFLGKFDPYLPPLILKKQYAQTKLDVDFGPSL